MKATAFEFRFRTIILFLVYLLGFWAPWERSLRNSVTTTWLELCGALASSHWLSLNGATILITTLAILCALKGTALRVWGTAYLGTAIVHDRQMHGEAVLSAGPYRHTRNPLYLGSFIFSIAVAILMPPTGAIFFLIAEAFFYYRLILGEEAYLAAHLTAQQQEAYLAYMQKVPRLWWRFRSRLPASSVRPQWIISALAESFYIAVTVCFAALAWRYNAHLLIKCVIISFGSSLLIRALLPQPATPKASASE